MFHNENEVQIYVNGLGTVNSIWSKGRYAKEASTKVKDLILEYDNKLSVFKDNSLISKINKNSGINPIEIDRNIYEILSLSKEYAFKTEGIFDITAYPISRLWKEAIKKSIPPNKDEILKNKELINYRDIILLNDDSNLSAMLKNKKQAIDLGGIAKGYIIDRAREIFNDYNVSEVFLNFGGSILSLGKVKKIGIQHPLLKTGGSMGSLSLENGEIAVTSGIYERGFIYNGERFHHIIDPRTCYPSKSGLSSVTLIGKNGLELDVLATTAIILGVEGFLLRFKDQVSKAVFINDNMDVFVTPSLKSNFTITNNEKEKTHE